MTNESHMIPKDYFSFVSLMEWSIMRDTKEKSSFLTYFLKLLLIEKESYTRSSFLCSSTNKTSSNTSYLNTARE